MGFQGSKAEAALLLSIAVAINFTFIYGMATKPVIAYHVTTPLDYNGTIDFDSEYLYVNLEARNVGLSPAGVDLVVKLYNFTLVGSKGSESTKGEGPTELRVALDEPIRPSGQENYNIALDSVGDTTYLVLIFSIESKPRLDPITGFHDSFAIFKPERPTALLLKNIDGNMYMRVRRR